MCVCPSTLRAHYASSSVPHRNKHFSARISVSEWENGTQKSVDKILFISTRKERMHLLLKSATGCILRSNLRLKKIDRNYFEYLSYRNAHTRAFAAPFVWVVSAPQCHQLILDSYVFLHCALIHLSISISELFWILFSIIANFSLPICLFIQSAARLVVGGLFFLSLSLSVDCLCGRCHQISTW